MNKLKIFYRDESASHPGKYIVRADFEKFHLKFTKGSYNVIEARLMGLSYPQYLRMCRDVFGAEIIGKNSLYPVPYFTGGEQLEMLLAQLNTRANSILWMREHPSFEEHKAVVQERDPNFYNELHSN